MLIVTSCVTAAWAKPSQPSVLIVGPKTATSAAAEMDLSMANFVAQEFANSGRVKPIVYGLVDPTFRDAVDMGKIVRPPSWPNMAQALQVGKQLGADYVFAFYGSTIKNSSEKAHADLYWHGKKIWSDALDLGIRDSSGIDPRATEQSLARTWSLHLETDKGPFKGLAPSKNVETPADNSGQEPVAPSVVPLVKTDDDAGIKSSVDRLLADGLTDRAIALLRDSVDQKPFSVERRIMLVQTLLDAHESASAGEEAERAVLIAPDRAELRALAAKAWLAAGKNDEAKSALNEAIARNPNAIGTRLMLAELSVARLEPDKALEHLDPAIKEKPSRQAYCLRALCRALLGGEDGVKKDLAASNALPPEQNFADGQRRYELAARTLDEALRASGDDARLLIQQSIVHPDDASLHDKAADMLRLLKARIAFLSAVSVPQAYSGSNERRLLAHRLFVQAVLGLQSFYAGGGQDAMTDARLDLGEALKQAASAKSAFLEEQKNAFTAGSN